MAAEFGWSEGISAFVGATLAFAVDWVRAKQDRHREEADAANRALLSLAQMYASLQNLWNQLYAEPVIEANKAGHTLFPNEVRATSPMPEEAVAVDVPSLSFLLRSRDPDLPNRLGIVVSAFRQHLVSEGVRSELHLEMQSKMEVAGISPGMEVTIGDVRMACGPKLWEQLVSTTNGQVESIPRTITDIVELQKQTLEVLKFEFPSRRFVKFQPQKLEPGKTFRTSELSRPPLWRRAMRGYFDWLRKRPAKPLKLNT